MNYEQMSNFEINLAVLRLTVNYEDILSLTERAGEDYVTWGDGYNWYEFDACSNWSVAGPLIEHTKICLEFNGMWRASLWDGVSVVDENPLRAAMIIFLMSKEKDEK